ncbi:MAG TPA: MFS transporter [Arenibaculum sp.]|nr:MFS transporter [Arenibaculum sp.]
MTQHRPLCPEGHQAVAGATAAPCPERARPWVLGATILASAMAFIDGTVVTIALPAIRDDLGIGFQTLQWVVNAYTLMLGALILVGGALGDRYGRRRVFVTGIVLFAVASAACAAAPDGAVLVLARAAQGIGAALLVPQSLAIITASFPRSVRGRAIGTWAAASAITTALGPSVGGLLIDAVSWRAAFWINLPLSAVAIWLALRHVPESRNDAASGPVDWLGAALAMTAVGGLTYGLTWLGTGQAQLLPPAALALGSVALGLFLMVERRAANPIVPLRLFGSRAFSGANVVTVFLYGALGGVLFLLPFELIERRGLSTAEAGLVLLPLGGIIGLLSRRFGALADTHGPRWLMAAGAALVAFAAGWLAVALDGLGIGVVAPVVVLAAGMSMVVSPLTTAVMNAAPDSHSGAASGINNAASRIAGLVAIAVLGTVASVVYAARTGAGIGAEGFGALPPPADPARAALEAAFLAAFSTAMILAMLSALAAAVTALATLRMQPAAVRADEDAGVIGAAQEDRKG